VDRTGERSIMPKFSDVSERADEEAPTERDLRAPTHRPDPRSGEAKRAPFAAMLGALPVAPLRSRIHAALDVHADALLELSTEEERTVDEAIAILWRHYGGPP
jgi:hypothetical protein